MEKKTEILINTVTGENGRLIAVPSVFLQGKNPYEIDFLIDKKNNKFEILEHFEYHKKDEAFPGGLFLLSTGKRLDKDTVWKAYKTSNIIYFFIVKT